MKTIDKSVNQSTQVAFQLMEEMAEIGQPVEMSTLARRLDMPKARAFRFLKTLLSIGYVIQDPDTERYRLSLKLYHLGQAIADQTELLTEARPLMVQLRDLMNQTITMSSIEPAGMRVLDIVRAYSPIEIVTRPGSILDFHASAQGKIALAFGNPDNWNIVREGPLAQWTPATNTDLARLVDEVNVVRAQGWAEAPGETLAGVNALSAPVRDARGALIATLTIAGPLVAIPSPPKPEQIDALLRASTTISENLGYSGE